MSDEKLKADITAIVDGYFANSYVDRSGMITDLMTIAEAHADVARQPEPLQVHLEFTGDPDRFVHWLRKTIRPEDLGGSA